jgi:hypothetical protein
VGELRGVKDICLPIQSHSTGHLHHLRRLARHQIVSLNGRRALYFNGEGSLIGWTDEGYLNTAVHLSNGHTLPVLGWPQATVEIDDSGRFFYAFDWKKGTAYVAELANPEQILFTCENHPYTIWSKGDAVFLGTSWGPGIEGVEDTGCERYEKRGAKWERTARVIVPGFVYSYDPWSDSVVVRRHGWFEWTQICSIFDMRTGEDRRLFGVPFWRFPVFLSSDWFHHRGMRQTPNATTPASTQPHH